jgi:hypothetical protein
MAKKPEDILFELDNQLLNAVDTFNDGIPKMQEQMLNKVIELTSELDRRNGNIIVSVKNLRIIRSIRKELTDAIVNDDYTKKVDDFVAAFEKVQQTNDQYFAAISTSFSKRELYTEIRKLAVEQTLEGLSAAGIEGEVIVPLADILSKNVTQGGKYTDFVGQVREYLTNTETSKGALDRYAKTYTTDSLYQFSANYNQTITEDLGFVWFQYAGDIQDTSREFCDEMVKARNNGCLKYIHISQFDELLKGRICDKQVEINPRTKLPNGFYNNTTTTNFQTYRGGWNCRHRLTAVPSAVVPKSLRELYEK